MSLNILELRNISKAYPQGRKVLDNLTYTLKAGEYTAIMGESGVGKSTLLNLIAGLDTPIPERCLLMVSLFLH